MNLYRGCYTILLGLISLLLVQARPSIAQNTRNQFTWSSVDTPTWSPDGTRIAFEGTLQESNDRDIWVMGLDGTNVLNLTDDLDEVALFPQWSPDGRYIAFYTLEDSDIWIVTPDATNRINLTASLEKASPYFAWSADGRLIALNTSTQSDSSPSIMMTTLWSLEIDTLTTTKLYEAPSLAGTFFPSWSPDDNQILFTAADLEQKTVNDWILSTTNLELKLILSGIYLLGAWSPNGQYISFVWSSCREGNTFAILNLETSELYHHPDANCSVTFQPLKWSPDSKYLAYDSNSTVERQFEFQIFDFEQKKIIYSGEGSYPAWSPDNRIAFVSTTSGSSAIWVMNVDGSNRHNVTGGR